METIILTAGAEDAGERIDAYLASCLSNLSRSYLQKILKAGGVTVAGKPVRASFRLFE